MKCIDNNLRMQGVCVKNQDRKTALNFWRRNYYQSNDLCCCFVHNFISSSHTFESSSIESITPVATSPAILSSPTIPNPTPT